ncbi:MAG: DNA translocase FtsK, partial [Spartobacteria bacterium]|nr:DNA translocase FtsK [Spartobacteria bacterium]
LVNHAEPADLQLILIDPKRVELAPFAHVPHLAMPPATDVSSAIEALDWAVAAMDERWVTLQQAGKKHISELADPPPYLLVVVDELADLMMTAGKRAEASIVRLLQLGRAAGVHLVLATQRPSTDVITGLIKTNTPSRMVFSVTSHTDSNVALGQSGAEKLLGQGDGLWWPAGASQPERIQGVFIDTDDLELPESTEERDERVRASMFAAVHEYSAPEAPATAPAPEPTPEPTPDEPATAALLPEPARELFDPDRALEAAYRKGRDHGRILAYSPPVTRRVMTPSDWWWAAALFVVGTVAGAVALPALPLAAGVWLAVTVVTRRRAMDRYEAFSMNRKTGETA